MKRLLTIILLLGVVLAADVCAYYFWGQGCKVCATVSPFIGQLEEKYPELKLKTFEIYFHGDNYTTYDQFCTEYCVERRGIPMVVIDDQVYLGYGPITNELEPKIQECLQNGCECPTFGGEYTVEPGHPTQVTPERQISLDVFVVAGAALVDSVNPCAFAVMIFLLTYLMALGARRRVWKVGLVYVGVVFLTYLGAGMGLFVAVQTAGMSRFVYWLGAVLAILAGFVNIKDFFFYGKGFSLEIPKSKKPVIEKYVKKASIPAAVVLGFVVSLFELPCTGGVYLAILGMLANSMTAGAALPYLVLYNLIFVLPLLAILFVVNSEFMAERAEHWRKKRRRHMKLASGLVLLGLGVAMLLGWL